MDIPVQYLRGNMKRIFLILIWLPGLMQAQVYMLDDLIEAGLKNSTAIQRSEINYQTAVSQRNTARWNLLPDVNFSATADNRLYSQSNVLAPDDFSTSLGLTVSKSVSLNDLNWFQYRYSTHDRKTAEIRRESSTGDFAYQVFLIYVDILSAEKQLRSLQESFSIQNRIWEQSNTLWHLGKLTEFDVKQNEIAVMNTQISLLRLQNAIGKSRQQLFSLILIPDEGYPLADLMIDTEREIPRLDYDRVNAIRLMQQEIERHDIMLLQDKLDNFPRLTLSYNLSRSVSGADLDFDTYNTNHGITLSLSYSLWNHFRNSESTKRDRFTRKLVELNLQDKVDEIEREYSILTRELDYLRQLDELYQSKLEQSRIQINKAEERYRLGMITQLELDKTRSEYIDSDIEYNSNRYQILARQEALNRLLSTQLLGKW